jgi:hypothetical protein
MLKYGVYHYFVPYLFLIHVLHLSSRASKSDGVSPQFLVTQLYTDPVWFH